MNPEGVAPRVASMPEQALHNALQKTRESLLWATVVRDRALRTASAEASTITKLQRQEYELLMHCAENGWEIPADSSADGEEKAPF